MQLAFGAELTVNDPTYVRFWGSLMKHLEFQRYYVSRSASGRYALERLIEEIDRVTRSHVEQRQRALEAVGLTLDDSLPEAEVQEVFENAGLRDPDDLRYSRLKDHMLGGGGDQYQHEAQFQRVLSKLVSLDVLKRVEMVRGATRYGKRIKKKPDVFYYLNYQGIYLAPHDLGLAPKDYFIANIQKQELAYAMEIGIEAYKALGRTAEDFYSEFRGRTAHFAELTDHYYKSEGEEHNH